MPTFNINAPLPYGPVLLDCKIGLPEPTIQAIKELGRQIPEPVPVRAMINTGAAYTSVTKDIAAALGLPMTSTRTVNTAAGLLTTSAYAGRIYLPGGHYWDTLQLIETVPLGNIDSVLGMDFLANTVFCFNGMTRHVSVSF